MKASRFPFLLLLAPLALACSSCKQKGELLGTIDMMGPTERRQIEARDHDVLGFRLDYSSRGNAWVGITIKSPTDAMDEKVVFTKSCKARQGLLDDCLIALPGPGRYVVEAGIVWEGGGAMSSAKLEIRRMSRDVKE